MVERKIQTELRRIVTEIRNKEFDYEKREEKPRDFNAYTLAQLSEAKEVLTFIRDTVDKVQLLPSAQGKGRPPFSSKELAKSILTMQFLQASERVAVGWLELLGPFLGLKQTPDDRVLGKAYENSEVIYILEKVYEQTAETIAGKETVFATDSTGLEETRKQNYESDKNKSAYPKLTSSVSVSLHVVAAYKFSRNVGDTTAFPSLIPQLQSQTVEEMSLDAGFLSRDICNSVAEELKAVPFILPKTNSTVKANGSSAWKNMLLSLVSSPQKWLSSYYNREQTESFHSSFKRRFAKPLQRRKPVAQGTEALARIILSNFIQLVHAKHEQKLDISILNHN